MSEPRPRTEAGRRLADEIYATYRVQLICDAEDEASALDRAALVAAVEGLPRETLDYRNGISRAAVLALLDAPAAPTLDQLRIARAEFVGKVWIDSILAAPSLHATGMSHPVAMVLAALAGETDPVQCGLAPEFHESFNALADLLEAR